MKRSASRFSHILSLLLVLIAIAVPSLAQTATGSIRGIIYDQSKAIITKAKVTATNKATGAERVGCNSTGEYIFSALPPGEYDVKVTVSGFKASLTSLTLQVGESVTNDFSLEIGRANRVHRFISSETPAINTTEYKINRVVTRKQIDNLPLQRTQLPAARAARTRRCGRSGADTRNQPE